MMKHEIFPPLCGVMTAQGHLSACCALYVTKTINRSSEKSETQYMKIDKALCRGLSPGDGFPAMSKFAVSLFAGAESNRCPFPDFQPRSPWRGASRQSYQVVRILIRCARLTL